MTRRLVRVGLTGGIATGKSHCLRRFARLGAPTIDADMLAREAVIPGSPALRHIVNRFGPEMIRPDGELDRAALGRRVFGDPSARHDLETIVHPVVYGAIRSWFDRLATEAASRGGPGQAMVAVADVPLLFETGHERDFDVVVVTSCPADEQLARLMTRDGLDETAARRRIAAQMPLDEKTRRADHVIDTSGTREETDHQVDEIWRLLKQRS